MAKALSFIRLDLITVKPYLTLKNFLIFFSVALFVTISTGVSAVTIGILMVYAALYVSYPFAVGERNGIDALYATLSIGRNTVVLGRYLFALAADILSGIIAYGFAFLALTVMGNGFNPGESALVTLAILVVYSLIQAVQLPMFFKWGYTKAKFLSYLPFIGLPAVILLINYVTQKTMGEEQIQGLMKGLTANVFLTLLLGIVIWLGILALSYGLSRMFYSKRDL